MGAILAATNVKCPKCMRKLCKLKEYDGMLFVEFKHKRSFVLAIEAIIKCIDCNQCYRVNATTGMISEIKIGNNIHGRR